MTIPILFEDGEALVIDKPGGLPIERPRAGGTGIVQHLGHVQPLGILLREVHGVRGERHLGRVVRAERRR